MYKCRHFLTDLQNARLLHGLWLCDGTAFFVFSFLIRVFNPTLDDLLSAVCI